MNEQKNLESWWRPLQPEEIVIICRFLQREYHLLIVWRNVDIENRPVSLYKSVQEHRLYTLVHLSQEMQTQRNPNKIQNL